MAKVDQVPGFSLMPGDEILSSISAMMDTIRSATAATGIVFTVDEDDCYRVEVCRSLPKLFLRGDRLSRPGGRSHTTSSGETSSILTPSGELESDYFSIGPVRREISLPVFSRVGAGRLTLFSNRPLSVSDELARAMMRIVAIHIETSLGLRSELEGISHRLNDAEDRAYRDSLTSLLNRHGFAAEIHREQRRRERYPEAVTVAVFDLDGLKMINDRYGHDAGDRFITTFADTLAQACRSIDSVARLGGDEFAILAPQTDLESAALMRQRYARIIRDAGLEVSMGFATDEDGSTPIADLVILADAKMYQDKRSRKRHMPPAGAMVG
jgi:diguanylate cyclase (GGDEF)-like protein